MFGSVLLSHYIREIEQQTVVYVIRIQMSNVQRGKKIVAATTLTTSINKNSTQKNCSNLQENIRKSTMRHPNANIERIKPKTS